MSHSTDSGTTSEAPKWDVARARESPLELLDAIHERDRAAERALFELLKTWALDDDASEHALQTASMDLLLRAREVGRKLLSLRLSLKKLSLHKKSGPEDLKNPLGYFRTVLRNKVRDEHRRRKTLSKTTASLEATEALEYLPDGKPNREAQAVQGEEALERWQMGADAQEVLNSMPESPQKAVFVLRHQKGLMNTQVAQIMGKSENLCAQWYRRFRKKLRKKLEEKRRRGS